MRQKRIPIEALERIDDLCAEFEKKWRCGEQPSIESVVAGEPHRDVLLAELVVLDVDYRRRRGEVPKESDYLAQFSQDESVIREALKDAKPSGNFEAPSVERLSELFPELQIIELIGVGGMGAVYKVRQDRLDRIVALKILPEEFGHDVKFALRFTREARTLAKLNHANIISVYEFGNVEDTYYFLMEFIDGSTLRDVVEARQLAPEQALAIVPHLCDALQYAHDQGVIHRDIKPENILLSVDGSVKIADFGLARLFGEGRHQHSLTATHQVMGTPRYMAPEQMEGARGVDHRADIYSLGVVIYEMLTGELPIGRFEVPSVKAAIDVRLDEVVLRTLEKEPRRRYQHASHIKSDVLNITSAENSLSKNAPVAPTVMHHADRSEERSSNSLQQQELAGRLLLTRRQLMERVETSLRPLFRWQVIQMIIGIAFIALGAQCWARNMSIPHRLVNGIIVHVYGVIVIASAAAVCASIKRIDFAQPVHDIRKKLDNVRSNYLRIGLVIGFPWWLMWIPVVVCMGVDGVMLPGSLYVSLIVGIPGFVICVWMYLRALGGDKATSESWKQRFSGECIASANRQLDEIIHAGIE